MSADATGKPSRDIVGIVNSEYTPVISLIFLAQRERYEVAGVVDTGFTGWVTVSRELAERLNLRRVARSRVILADGSVIFARRYEGVVLWHGEEHAIQVDEADGDPLIGMRLLEGSHLYMDARFGGEVRISRK